MNIAILSQNPHLYSTQSLLRACRLRGHYVRVIDHVKCELQLVEGKLFLKYQGEIIHNIEAIIPRIGVSATIPGEATLRQLLLKGAVSAISIDGLLNSRKKLRSLQILSNANIPIPDSIQLGVNPRIDRIIEQLGGLPIIVKLHEGTHGHGVMLAESKYELENLIRRHQHPKKKLLLQKFIPESKGEDLRAIVVNGKVVASMKRKARPGEFRSNLHLGGSSIHVKLDSREEATAIAAAKALKLEVAGVDMLQSDSGPLILEVNPSPGLEGIEGTTKVDVAGHIVQYLEYKYDLAQAILS